MKTNETAPETPKTTAELRQIAADLAAKADKINEEAKAAKLDAARADRAFMKSLRADDAKSAAANNAHVVNGGSINNLPHGDAAPSADPWQADENRKAGIGADGKPLKLAA